MKTMRLTYRQKNKQTTIQAYTYKQTNIKIDKYTNRQILKQTNIQIDKQTNNVQVKTDRQSYKI